jgi:5-methylthioadenosine/S-adenosylhomocysteine deaminase
MLGAGVQVGLGTDGAATNNNLDLWEEVRLAPLLAKTVSLDPTSVPAREALWMATRMGGRAIHQPEIGVLAEGYKADIIMLDLQESTFVPVFEPATYIDHLVYAAGRESVRSVWVNGRQVVKDREVLTVDEEAVRVAAQRAAISVSERVASASMELG